jgi:hypothetical protein
MATIVSKQKIANGDFLETAKFAFYADPLAFEQAFANVGIRVNSAADLPVLAAMVNSGSDINGTGQTDALGNPLPFSGWHVLLNNVQIRNSEVNKGNVKLA